MSSAVDVTLSADQNDWDIVALGLASGGLLKVKTTTNVNISGFQSSGISGEFEFELTSVVNSNTITIKQASASSSVGNRVQNPGFSGTPPDFVLGLNGTIRFRLATDPSSGNKFWYHVGASRQSVIAPADLKAETSTQAVPFVIRTPYTAGTPGTADDVTIATPAFNWRLIDCYNLCSTAIVGSTIQLRNLSGGGGSTRSSALSTGATGCARNNDTQSFSFSSNANLFARRSDRGIAGEIIIVGIHI